MIFITQCDSPAFWQTYLPDLASIIMEGILIFNKHSLFLLTVIILLVGWLLFYTIYYFIEYSNKFSGEIRWHIATCCWCYWLYSHVCSVFCRFPYKFSSHRAEYYSTSSAGVYSSKPRRYGALWPKAFWGLTTYMF